MNIKIGRMRGLLSLPRIIAAILLGACLVSLLFFVFWRQLNQKVELILRKQFNQQQLTVARKVVDNVETYFDFLRNALLGYTGLYRETQPGFIKFEDFWGVAVVAPVVEVSGSVGEVMHRVLSLVRLFFLMVLVAGGGFTVIALIWNKALTREVDLKTKELESQGRLLRSERFAAVGEAAAYVSHEIKNPLMVIGGFIHRLQRHFGNDQTAKEKFDMVIDEVKRLENFLGELRDFTRPAAPVMQKVDLNQVIREEQALMQEAAKEKGLTIIDSLQSDLPPVEADRNQMKQILVNLIKNAMQAIEGEGRIILVTGVTDGQIWFSVQDTGKGIAPEPLAKIFDPFFTTKDKGTGLGLAVTNKIVIDHQGTIEVESTPGEGSTFTVKLPKL